MFVLASATAMVGSKVSVVLLSGVGGAKVWESTMV